MPLRPSLHRERAAWADATLLVGVDEAGRGPLAGPVVAAAVVFPPTAARVRGLRDSKILPRPRPPASSPERIRARALGYGVGAASSHEIDRLNIRVASALAMRRAIARCSARRRSPGRPHRILIDGLPLPEVGYPHDALVDGDARCQSIAAAAILAKTVRDRLMARLAQRHPGYGWQTNMGYGTDEHHEGLKLHGPTCHHRLHVRAARAADAVLRRRQAARAHGRDVLLQDRGLRRARRQSAGGRHEDRRRRVDRQLGHVERGRPLVRRYRQRGAAPLRHAARAAARPTRSTRSVMGASSISGASSSRCWCSPSGAGVSLYQGIVHVRHPEPIRTRSSATSCSGSLSCSRAARGWCRCAQFNAAKGDLGFWRRSEEQGPAVVHGAVRGQRGAASAS